MNVLFYVCLRHMSRTSNIQLVLNIGSDAWIWMAMVLFLFMKWKHSTANRWWGGTGWGVRGGGVRGGMWGVGGGGWGVRGKGRDNKVQVINSERLDVSE